MRLFFDHDVSVLSFCSCACSVFNVREILRDRSIDDTRKRLNLVRWPLALHLRPGER